MFLAQLLVFAWCVFSFIVNGVSCCEESSPGKFVFVTALFMLELVVLFYAGAFSLII